MNLATLLVLLPLTAASFSNPQHDKHHKNSIPSARCLLNGSVVDAPEVTIEELSKLKTKESVDALTDECLLALKDGVIASMTDEFFELLVQRSNELPTSVHLMTLVHYSKKTSKPSEAQSDHLERLLKSPSALLKMLDLASKDPDTNAPAVQVLLNEQRMAALSPQFFAKLSSSHFKLLSPKLFRVMTGDQFAAITPEAISSLSVAQFVSLSSEAKQKITAAQASAIPEVKEEKDSNQNPLCLAVFLSKKSFTPVILDVLKKRCSWYLKNDAQTVFSTQLVALMAVISLAFLVSS